MTQLWTTEELTSHEFPEPSYLIEPMIPQGGIFMIHGKPGVGKTALVTSLAHAINNGIPLFGRFPVRKGPVVVIQADMTSQIQQDRVRKAVKEILLEDTYWAVEEDGSIPLIDITTLSLTKRDLVEQIQEIDPALVIWDTLRKIHMLPENASETVVKVFNGARKVCPKATHGFLHHDRKASRDPDALSTADEDFIGSQQWKGSADATIQLKEIGVSPKRLLLEFHKARTSPDQLREAFSLEMDMKSMLLLPTRAFKTTPAGIITEGRASRSEACRLVGTLP